MGNTTFMLKGVREMAELKDMLTPLEKRSQFLKDSIEVARDTMRKCEADITTWETELQEIANGMIFVRKWILKEKLDNTAITVTPETETKTLGLGRRKRFPISAAITEVIDSDPDRDFSSSEVADMLLARKFETASTDFLKVVQNNLRVMTKNHAIGFTKRGRYYTYYSLKRGRNGEKALIFNQN